jgi:hypothetical protein
MCHDRNHSENKQQVDQKPGDMKQGEATDPTKHKNESENQEHELSSFLRQFSRAPRAKPQQVRSEEAVNRCFAIPLHTKNARVRARIFCLPDEALQAPAGNRRN